MRRCPGCRRRTSRASKGAAFQTGDPASFRSTACALVRATTPRLATSPRTWRLCWRSTCARRSAAAAAPQRRRRRRSRRSDATAANSSPTTKRGAYSPPRSGTNTQIGTCRRCSSTSMKPPEPQREKHRCSCSTFCSKLRFILIIFVRIVRGTNARTDSAGREAPAPVASLRRVCVYGIRGRVGGESWVCSTLDAEGGVRVRRTTTADPSRSAQQQRR
mmetsp:Transcript_21170/g.68515  ORF Transcript_21170/g.68515 Transcript_21170/m.68515 type:complete len:218 (+) Transcript_21170:252-905(+)